MKNLRKILILLSLVFNLFADTLKDVNLVDFASIVANNSNVNIILNDELNISKYTFTTSKDFDSFSLNEFKKLLELKDLKLIKFKNYYFVDYKNALIDNKAKVRIINLKNNSYEVALKIIDVFNSTKSNTNLSFNNNFKNKQDAFNKSKNQINQSQKNINEVSNIKYIDTTNSIIFTCDDESYYYLKNEILKADKDLEQVTFKITITETNTDKLFSLGNRFGSHLKVIDNKDFKSFLNVFSASSNTNIINSNSFYSIIDLLSQDGITNLKASPFLVAKNNKKVEFVNAMNIPFLTSQSEVKSSNSSTTSSFSYKDVGLKIYLTPHILKNKVIFDLELIVEDVLNNSSQTPTTSKKYIKSTYTINKNEILLIGGINKEIVFKSRGGIPILKDLPLLKYIFGYERENTQNQSLLISVELLSDFADASLCDATQNASCQINKKLHI